MPELSFVKKEKTAKAPTEDEATAKEEEAAGKCVGETAGEDGSNPSCPLEGSGTTLFKRMSTTMTKVKARYDNCKADTCKHAKASLTWMKAPPEVVTKVGPVRFATPRTSRPATLLPHSARRACSAPNSEPPGPLQVDWSCMKCVAKLVTFSVVQIGDTVFDQGTTAKSYPVANGNGRDTSKFPDCMCKFGACDGTKKGGKAKNYPCMCYVPKKSRYSNVCWGEHVWCDSKTPNPTERTGGGSHCVPDPEMGIELADLSLVTKAKQKEEVTADPPTQTDPRPTQTDPHAATATCDDPAPARPPPAGVRCGGAVHGGGEGRRQRSGRARGGGLARHGGDDACGLDGLRHRPRLPLLLQG